MFKKQLWLAVLLVLALALPITSAGAAPPRQDDFGDCGDPATPIHEVQGTEDRTPFGGTTLTIEGVVVGDYQDTIAEFGGFYMQEEDADADADPLTSEGIFIDSKLVNVDVEVGDVVRVTGAAFELSADGANLTQLRRVKAITICDSGVSITPVEVELPVADLFDWEAYEGMLVTLPQTLTVSEVYNLGRYGEIKLSVDGRLYEPTNIARPGADALAVQAENNLRSIVLDDGNNQQNLDPTRYPAGGLSADNGLRDGDTVTGITGVIDQRFGIYRIHATGPVEFVTGNPRSASPPDVGGSVRAASFNVLNYFNGDGRGGGFPTSRGAGTADEFDRQRDKIINAIVALDADVIGLMEIENDGDGPDSAVADLVDGLNAVAGDGTYAYISDPDGFKLPDEGADEIKQAIIYQPASVTPVGDPVTTLDAPFDIRRPPVTQAFEENTSGEVFILVVNHLKSKGCTGAGVDPDTGDGQGCWNQERTQAAHTLLDWLATDPTGTGDPDVLVIGDLNSYAMEDPLMVFADGDYTNLITRFEGDEGYSYVYFGQAGSLDHALASPGLEPQVSGAATWHINADEPTVFDYNVEYKSANHVESLYAGTPFRSSDHDPVVIGLALSSAPEPTPTPEPTATEEPEPTQEVVPTDEPTEEPTQEVVPTEEAEPTEEMEPTQEAEPTEELTPPDDNSDTGDDSSEDDNTPGTIAIIIGALAVLVAMIGGWFTQRNRQKK